MAEALQDSAENSEILAIGTENDSQWTKAVMKRLEKSSYDFMKKG